jgi:hypothetical protein
MGKFSSRNVRVTTSFLAMMGLAIYDGSLLFSTIGNISLVCWHLEMVGVESSY